MADSEHNVTININGNANVAVNALNKVKSGLGGVGRAISMVSGALGKINWAINGIRMIIDGFTWLKDKITETAREIAKMRFDAVMAHAANETARLVGYHEKLAKLMKEELDALSKQRAVDAIEQQGSKDYEDGKREADRARQIFEARTPEEEQALKDKFTAEDEQRARDEKKVARKQRIDQLDKEETVYTATADSAKKKAEETKKQIEDEKFNLVRANGKDEYAAPIKERIKSLEAALAKYEATYRESAEKAAFNREQIAALENQKDYEGTTAGEWQRKTEAKKRAEEQAKKEAEEKAAADKKSADEAARAAEKQQSEENRRKTEQVNSLESFADRAAAADGVSQNRLTAMGLGSGVSADGKVVSEMRTVIGILRETLKATRENKPAEKDNVSVYGE